MKEAMISPQETKQYQTGWEQMPSPISGNPDILVPVMGGSGYRVAQVVEQGQTFPMAEPIYWVECADNIEQDLFVYDPSDQQFHPASLPSPV